MVFDTGHLVWVFFKLFVLSDVVYAVYYKIIDKLLNSLIFTQLNENLMVT